MLAYKDAKNLSSCRAVMESWDGWDDFLKVIASDHNLTSDQKEVFLVRLSRKNINKTNQDIANEVIKGEPEQALSAYNKRMNEVFNKLSQSFPEINSDSRKKVERTRTCLEQAYLKQQNQAKSEASSQAIAPLDWQKICHEMLNSQKQHLRQQVTQIGCELDVYVPLGLVERKHQSRRRDDYSLSPEQGSGFFQPTEEEIIKTYEHNDFLKEVIQQGKSKKSQGKRIAIIGEPGAGKTTILQQIAFSQDTPGFPIWISLKSLGEKSLEKYLCENWLKGALKTSDFTKHQQDLEELFKSGNVLLLLDGVDEMPASSPVDALVKIRDEVTGWVADARIVLTCRLNVWEINSNSLQGFDIYRTLDFSYGDGDKPDQVKQFIWDWFIKAEKPELGEPLRKKLEEDRHKRIRDLVKNPLRLSLLCQSWYFKQGDLPETKAALYEQFTRAFYDWKDELFHTSLTKRKQLNTALGFLAREAIDQEKSRFAIRENFAVDVMGEDLFNLACKLHWLNFVYKDADTNENLYAFFHPTFQEYFAACTIADWDYFLKHVPHNPKQGTYRIFEPQWKEVYLLWLGIDEKKLIRSQKEALLQALVTFEDGWEKLYHYQAYFLAALGIAEFQDGSSTDGIEDVFYLMNIEESGLDEAVYKAELASAKKLHNSINANVIVANIVRIGLYLSRQIIKIPIAEKARVLLGETDRARAITLLSWLLQTYPSDIPFLSQIIGEIGKGNETAIKAIECWVQNAPDEHQILEAAANLGKISPGNEIARQVLTNLIDNTENEYIRSSAAWNLGKIDPANEVAIKALIKILQKPEKAQLCKSAACYIGEIEPGNEEAKELLVLLLDATQNQTIRMTIAESLGRVDPGNKIAINELEKLIPDNGEKNFWQAAAALGKIDPDNIIAIETLEKLIKNALPEASLSVEGIASSLVEINPNNQIAAEAFKLIIKKINEEGFFSSSVINMDKRNYYQALFQNTAIALAQMDYNKETNQIAIDALVEYIQFASYNGSIVKNFKKILRDDQAVKVIKILKPFIINWSAKNSSRDNLDRSLYCHEILWYCAENMSYPDFYQAWYN